MTFARSPGDRLLPLSLLGVLLGLVLCACSGGSGGAAKGSGVPSAGLVSARVRVPSGMRFAPFDAPRRLNVPKGVSVSVYARVPKARFMAVAPGGDLFVSQPSTGKVLLLRPTGNPPGSGDPKVFEFATGLRKPHGLVFHKVGATTYLYVSESDRIDRFVYRTGDTGARDRETVVSGLPDASSPELKGTYRHELKNMAVGPDGKLYVSIGSSCNACAEDATSDPVRGAVYRYDAGGSNGRLFARGLRNAEGLAFVPGTDELWAAVNNRDDIAYPFKNTSGNYGKVVPSYVDDHPPEELTRLKDGGNYGWPFCNPNPDTKSGLTDMPFDRDYQTDADGHVDCAKMDRIDRGMQAHSAPLGLTFLRGADLPARYENGAAVALHGSWNRERKTGYEIVYFPWDRSKHEPGVRQTLVSGWLDAAAQESWGRPVDVAVDDRGDVFVSDDESGTVYKLTSSGTTGR